MSNIFCYAGKGSKKRTPLILRTDSVYSSTVGKHVENQFAKDNNPVVMYSVGKYIRLN